jgi:phosphopantothenoylcysteine decarboxylase/phosphopantothenate--cysteine ligase
LKKAGAEVKVTTTKHALEFVTPLTLQTLSGYPVYSDVFAAINEHSTEHISLPDWADLMLVAPATASTICKMACGIADNALTTTFAAMRKPVVIAPAMNDKMYLSPATQQAIHTLSQWENITMLECAEGTLACGTSGKGRMQEIQVLLAAIEYTLTPKTLMGKRILITAGPTQEAIDPVRYITNASTGKMGYALAQACLCRGAHVTLISGPTSIPMEAWLQFAPLRMVNIVSSEDMYRETTDVFTQERSDISILCAAVADFTPMQVSTKKIKKEPNQKNMSVDLKITHDIAATLGQLKQQHQQLIGFALETHNEIDNAKRKMQSKNLDMIVLNSLQDKGAGFGVDTNKVTLLYADGRKKCLPLLSKQEVADAIISELN